MKTSNYISLSDSPTFFVKFQFDSRSGFIVKAEDLIKCLRSEQRNSGIEFIKKVDGLNGKFERVAKQFVFDCAKTWAQSEDDKAFLSQHYFFKGCK